MSNRNKIIWQVLTFGFPHLLRYIKRKLGVNEEGKVPNRKESPTDPK